MTSTKETEETRKNLLAHYRFNNSNDFSDNASGSCTNYSTTYSPSSIIGIGSRKFNGTNQWIDCIPYGEPTGRSISLWFTKNIDESSDYLLDGRDASGTGWWFLTHYNGHDINFRNLVIYDGTAPNTWYHVVVTLNTSESNMYLDGVHVSSGAGLAQADLGFETVRMGTRYSNSGYFPGRMADIRLYGTMLTANEAKELYEQRACLDEDGNLWL